MAKCAVLVLGVVALATSALSFKVSEGVCPDVEATDDFNTEGFMGKWYVQKRYTTDMEPAQGKKLTCETITLSGSAGNTTINIVDKTSDGSVFPQSGSASNVNSGKESSELIITFDKPVVPNQPPFHYHVIALKPNHYALAYTCLQFGPKKIENAMVLSRHRLQCLVSKYQINKLIDVNQFIDKESFIETEPLFHC